MVACFFACWDGQAYLYMYVDGCKSIEDRGDRFWWQMLGGAGTHE